MNKDFHSFSDCHDSDASLPYIYIMIAKLPFMFFKSTNVDVFNQSLISYLKSLEHCKIILKAVQI